MALPDVGREIARFLSNPGGPAESPTSGVDVLNQALSDGSAAAPVPPGFSEVGDGLVSGLDPLSLAFFVGVTSLAGAVVFRLGTRYVTPDDVLRNDVRAHIYRHLKIRVGANLKQITDELRLTTTNAIWHLRKLEEAGLIHSRRFNGFKVFYPAEGGVHARRMSLSLTALANGNAREIFEFVVANPGAHQREIARSLGVNHGTVRWHLKKLRRAEILTETKRGKASAYYPTEMGVQAMHHLRVSAPGTVAVVVSAAADGAGTRASAPPA